MLETVYGNFQSREPTSLPNEIQIPTFLDVLNDSQQLTFSHSVFHKNALYI